ncbi:M1 family aminopeptidase [Tsuneonella rigui]|uniref:M1 family aminopeptidase n=1 Tax=Tsuneonella rigui TaxID=1708790 RepID=UPI000F7E767F|nr:M1 family aminopeptidase [Tsuneonella rigui]
MIFRVAAFEVSYQLRSPVFWGTSIVFLLLAFATVAADEIRLGWGGQVFRNSPYAIAITSMSWAVFAIFIATAFVATVVLRDEETGFGSIIHATPLAKSSYLLGRFLGGFATVCLAFVSVPLGQLLAVMLPGVDPDTVGPIRLGDYAYAYALLSLPTLFILSTTFFTLSTVSRSLVATYVGALVVLALYLFTRVYLSRPEFGASASLFDPFGLAPLSFVTKHWTAFDRNSLLPPAGGLLLENRLIWGAVSLAFLAAAWAIFTRRGLARSPGKARAGVRETATSPRLQIAQEVQPPRSPSLSWAPLAALVRHDLGAVLRSPVFLVILGFAFVNTVIGLWLAGEDPVSRIYPVTRVMIQTMRDEFVTIPLFVAAFYAGELVWRDREARINEIIDSTPSPDWAFLAPKFLAIALVLLAMGVMSIAAAVSVQLLKGYHTLELGKYLTWYLAPWYATMLMYAALALFVQTIAPHKFVGLLIILLVYIGLLNLPSLGFESHLYLYGSTTPVPLSDMNGVGRFAGYAAWYQAYWAAGAIALLVLTYVLWRRGASSPLKSRLRRLPHRLRGLPGAALGLAVAVMAGLGGYIFYNNYVLNDFPTFVASQRWAADYERTLLAYDDDPQPTITAVRMNVALYPAQTRAETRGSYVIENKTGVPLDRMYVSWPAARSRKTWLGVEVSPALTMRQLAVEGARPVKDYPRFNFRVFAFRKPMQPGERRTVTFDTVREQKGFRNSGNDERIVANGTFIENYALTPQLGVSRWVLLTDRATRRKYGLAPELARPNPADPRARRFNYLRHDADYVDADITVSGPADQVLLAPGTPVSRTVADKRQTVHFANPAPILDFFSIQAAKYAVLRDRWNDKQVEIYYHPAHAYNVKRMAQASKDALAYYTKNFGPYQFDQFRVVEFPAYGNYAQAFPGTVPFSEAAGFIIHIDDKNGVDFNSYVTAHELAHQWWFHQVLGADVEGSSVLSETLAQYSTLMVMEKRYGPAMIHRFLKQANEDYLKARGSENVAEPTLERVEGQAYVAYAKGGAVMYLLKDRLGEAAVNRALRSLLSKFGLKGPPYATSQDLVAALRAEARPEDQQLITDLFQRITLYDFKVTSASSRRLTGGRWQVDLTVSGRKMYADGKGIEREAPLSELVDIGVFARDPASAEYRPADVISVKKVRLTSGERELSLIVERKPAIVGVDPFIKYLGRDTSDNVLPLQQDGK